MENVMNGKGQCKLVMCGCGKLHFTYGAVTLHFDRDEFLRFSESVGRLGPMVRQAVQGSGVSPRPLRNVDLCH